jgi:hypothetical protein
MDSISTRHTPAHSAVPLTIMAMLPHSHAKLASLPALLVTNTLVHNANHVFQATTITTQSVYLFARMDSILPPT